MAGRKWGVRSPTELAFFSPLVILQRKPAGSSCSLCRFPRASFGIAFVAQGKKLIRNNTGRVQWKGSSARGISNAIGCLPIRQMRHNSKNDFEITCRGTGQVKRGNRTSKGGLKGSHKKDPNLCSRGLRLSRHHRRSKLGGQVAVNFESDANFHDGWGSPSH